MVKENDSVANSVKTAEVRLFDATPVQRLTPELIPGAYKVYVTARKNMRPPFTLKLDAEIIAPTEVGGPSEVMNRADGMMVNTAVEGARVSATVIMALQSIRKSRRVVEGNTFEELATLNLRPRD